MEGQRLQRCWAAAAGAVRDGWHVRWDAPSAANRVGKTNHSVIELITCTVKPDSWDDVGGPGSISAYNGLFVSHKRPRSIRMSNTSSICSGKQPAWKWPGAKVVR